QRHDAGRLAEILRRLRQPVWKGRRVRWAEELPRGGRAVAVVLEPDARLPDLPTEIRLGNHRADLRRAGIQRLRYEPAARPSTTRVLRAVSRDGPGVRFAADGGGGDFLLLPSRGRKARPGAGRPQGGVF